MGLCLFNHIDDFEEIEEKKVENVVQINQEIKEENNNITQVTTTEESNKEKIIENEKLPEKEISLEEEKKEAVVQEIKQEQKEEVIVTTSSKDVQKELDLIVSKQKIYFKRLSTDITEKSYVVIEEIANFLKENEKIKIEIGGHTDAKGKDDVNEWVSLQRALSVKKELINLGITKERIKAKGYGESQPLVPNDKNGYSIENRRVEFKIIEE